MIKIRKATDRGHGDHGWLNSYHTFSFANYRDRDQMGFRSLRVMNEDRVAAGQGFGTHAHDNMEIVSYVISGALEHKDSMGNGEVLKPGEFQRISAGSGITHSEFNPSQTDPTHFYQIWLLPDRQDIEPSYEQKRFEPTEMQNQLRLVASPDGADGSLFIHQDVRIYLGTLDAGNQIDIPITPGRYAWLQVVAGNLTANGDQLATSDGAAISDEGQIQLKATDESKVIWFDMA